MAKEQFREWNPIRDISIKYIDGAGNKQYWIANSEGLLNNILRIVESFMEQGFKLTNRQLYYQLVAGAAGKGTQIPNADEVYKRVNTFLTDGRYGGYIDWEAIEDRGRVPTMPPEWDNIKDFVESATRAFRLPRWQDQECYVELYTEKQALESILEPIANKHHIYFGYNKGYSGAAPFYDLSKRVMAKISEGKFVKILYAGDLDPSGVDMIRDIRDRITEFLTKGDEAIDIDSVEEYFEVIPLALNMEQVRQYNPPPNPAKITDPRAKGYIAIYGNVSWELDALRPEVLTGIIETGIQLFLDVDKYNAWIAREKPLKQKLQDFADSLVNSEEPEV